jgi:hypothetical protein
MKEIRVGIPTLLVISATVGAAAFAAGRSTSDPPSAIAHELEPHAHEALPQEALSQEVPLGAGGPALPPGHPATGDGLPPGHPMIDPGSDPAAAPEETSLDWRVPARWEVLPNTSSMRLATYRAPRAAGDAADAEISVTQAGGSVQANADRWIGQFDAEAQKHAKRTARKIAGLDVTLVEVEGTYGGGMGSGARPEQGWALVGAIVATPGMPHFFKITGPVRTVQLARPDLETLLASLTVKRNP